MLAVIGMAWCAPVEAAILSGLQIGVATSTASGTVTVSISSIDTTRSFLIFQTRSSGDRPASSMLLGRIASATTLEFIRATSELTPATINIQWYVLSFSSGVSVQRGEFTQNATTINVAITPVSAVSRAFVTWSKSSASTETSWDSDDPTVGELTSTSNLQFRVTTSTSLTQQLSWQVIEFTNPSDINVQKGSTNLSTNASSVTVTLPTAVDVDRTFVLVGYRVGSNASGSDVGARMLRAVLTNSTTITIDRAITGDTITEIGWQAVELRDGSTVQRGSQTLPTATATATVTLGRSVDVTSAVPFASVQPVSGQNMGRSNLSTDDIIGSGAVTMTLSPTQLSMTRNYTAATADIGWFVVQFARRFVTIID
jgi:hypothetical protein